MAKQIPELQTRTPRATSEPETSSAIATGHMNCSTRLPVVDLRHASSGPTPVSVSSANPIGSIHLLKNGGPTVSRSPVTASLSVGNMVANSTKKAENSRIQLLARNAASLDTHESSSLRDRSSGSRRMTSPKLNVTIRTMKTVNSRASSGSSPKECTDCTTPDRVMNVAKIVRKRSEERRGGKA